MITIVCVYNNIGLFNNIFKESLERQNVKYELIALDNTKNEYKSAAKALNYGAKKATGKYIMFVHQDVELNSDFWLKKVEKYLDNISNLGIAGVAGMSGKGRNYEDRRRGYISNRGKLWGEPFEKYKDVQTLDELLLIAPKSVFDKLQFDEKRFDHWHCYGVDYCLSLKKIGLNPYVIPFFVYHRSPAANRNNLLKYQQRLYNKHKKHFRCIYTICGEINWAKLKINRCKKIFSPLYKKMFKDWIDYLKDLITESDTVLDLGCGCNSPIQYCKPHFSLGVELCKSYLEESRKKGIHDKYLKEDIRSLKLEPKSFDIIFCSKAIEHLKKEEGYDLIEKMKKWARKRIIITAPNGYIWQDNIDNNKFQRYQSE